VGSFSEALISFFLFGKESMKRFEQKLAIKPPQRHWLYDHWPYDQSAGILVPDRFHIRLLLYYYDGFNSHQRLIDDYSSFGLETTRGFHQLASTARQNANQLQDNGVWLDHNRTIEFKNPANTLIFHVSLSVSFLYKRPRNMDVYFSQDRLLFFLRRGPALILQYEIPRYQILLVTHATASYESTNSFPTESALVTIFWASDFALLGNAISFVELFFAKLDESKIWAAFLVKPVQQCPSSHGENAREKLAEVLPGNFLGGSLSLENTMRAEGNVIADYLPEMTTAGQVIRLMRTIKNPKFNEASYRVFRASNGLKIIVLQGLGSNNHYATMDVDFEKVDKEKSQFACELPFNSRTVNSSCLLKFKANRDKYPSRSDHLSIYLGARHGTWNGQRETHYAHYSIEMSTHSAKLSGSDAVGLLEPPSFQAALTRFLHLFVDPDTRMWTADHTAYISRNYQLSQMKLFVVSSDPINTVAQWIVDALSTPVTANSDGEQRAQPRNSNNEVERKLNGGEIGGSIESGEEHIGIETEMQGGFHRKKDEFLWKIGLADGLK
jgi:hypothetical protein